MIKVNGLVIIKTKPTKLLANAGLVVLLGQELARGEAIAGDDALGAHEVLHALAGNLPTRDLGHPDVPLPQHRPQGCGCPSRVVQVKLQRDLNKNKNKIFAQPSLNPSLTTTLVILQ